MDGHSHALPRPFMVIATQNPVEHHGTYPLPESQLDRFLMRLRIGYPDAASERQIVRNSAARLARPPAALRAGGRRRSAAAGSRAAGDRGRGAGGLHARHRGADAHARIAGAGREPARIAGAVPRGAGAWPWLEGRDYAIPDDVKRLAVAGLRAPRGDRYAHRCWCRAAATRASASSKKSSARWKCPCRVTSIMKTAIIGLPMTGKTSLFTILTGVQQEMPHGRHRRAHRRRQGPRPAPGSSGRAVRTAQGDPRHGGIRGYAADLEGKPARPGLHGQPARSRRLRPRAAPVSKTKPSRTKRARSIRCATWKTWRPS